MCTIEDNFKFCLAIQGRKVCQNTEEVFVVEKAWTAYFWSDTTKLIVYIRGQNCWAFVFRDRSLHFVWRFNYESLIATRIIHSLDETIRIERLCRSFASAYRIIERLSSTIDVSILHGDENKNVSQEPQEDNMSSTGALIFDISSYLIVIASLIFNSLGIYLLFLIRSNDFNQTIIIINLSISEILIAIGWIAEHTASRLGMTFNDRGMLIIWGLRAGVYCFWFFDMYILAIDRLIGCNFPLKHLRLVNKRNIEILMTLVWVICLANSLFLLLVDTKLYHFIYNKFVWLIFDCIAVVIYTVTYTSIFISSYRAKRKRRSTANSIGNTRKNRQFLKIVSLIILTFLIFEVLPTTISMTYYYTNKTIPWILESIMNLSYQLALLTDPLIYIFLQSRVRMLLSKKVRRTFRKSFLRKSRKVVVYQIERRSYQDTKLWTNFLRYMYIFIRECSKITCNTVWNKYCFAVWKFSQIWFAKDLSIVHFFYSFFIGKPTYSRCPQISLCIFEFLRLIKTKICENRLDMLQEWSSIKLLLRVLTNSCAFLRMPTRSYQMRQVLIGSYGF